MVRFSLLLLSDLSPYSAEDLDCVDDEADHDDNSDEHQSHREAELPLVGVRHVFPASLCVDLFEAAHARTDQHHEEKVGDVEQDGWQCVMPEVDPQQCDAVVLVGDRDEKHSASGATTW